MKSDRPLVILNEGFFIPKLPLLRLSQVMISSFCIRDSSIIYVSLFCIAILGNLNNFFFCIPKVELRI